VFAAGIAIRLILLPSEGLRDDLDQFVGWVHHIAVGGLGSLYSGTDAGPVTFGPVMACIWAVLAAVQPAFASATDAADVGIRSLMKVPAVIADVGLAALVLVALRDRGRWAVLGSAAILLHPAVIDVSAWWGQYESTFALSALGAVLAASRGRNDLAAALVMVSLLTKPQAIPFVLPFAAWFWAAGYQRASRGGGDGGGDSRAAGARAGAVAVARAGLIGLGVAVVLWLPFIPAGGPAHYLANLATYQNEIFNVLSLRAWNVWWLVQGAGASGGFAADDVAFLGPLTLRHVGYLVTGALSLVIARAIVRDPRPRTLILGLTASVLVFFTFMTQMHERYAYAALIFLVLLLPETWPRRLWLGLGVAFTLNLLAAIPPTEGIGRLLPVTGPLGIAGSIALIGVTLVSLRLLGRAGPDAMGAGAAPDAIRSAGRGSPAR
jgi:hypothetical protein